MKFRALLVSSVLAVISANAAAIGQPFEVHGKALREITQPAIVLVSAEPIGLRDDGNWLLKRTGSIGRLDICANVPRQVRSRYRIIVDATDFGAAVKSRSVRAQVIGQGCRSRAESAPKRDSKFVVKPRQPRPAALVRTT